MIAPPAEGGIGIADYRLLIFDFVEMLNLKLKT